MIIGIEPTKTRHFRNSNPLAAQIGSGYKTLISMKMYAQDQWIIDIRLYSFFVILVEACFLKRNDFYLK
jgi:hypothetical protein